MNATEIQSAIDNDGYVLLTKGTHDIDTTIKLDGQIGVLIEGQAQSVLNWTGPATGSMFEFEQNRDISEYNEQQVHFMHVTAISTKKGASIIRSVEEHPNSIFFENCNFTATGAYCIDFDDMRYTVPPYFLNMRTNGGGAARLRSAVNGPAVNTYWFTSQMMIEGWVHNGSHRVGPAFDLRGCKGTIMRGILDTGSPALLPELRTYYQGPVSYRNDNIGFFSKIENYRVEYDEDFSGAPGCFLHEIRDDSQYALGQHGNIKITNMTMHDDNIDAGVKHVRIIGGHDDNDDHVVVADLHNCESIDSDKFLVGGRAWVTLTRPWYNPGEEEKFAAAKTYFEQMSANDSFNDPIMSYSDGFPANTTGLDNTYNTGDARYNNWTGVTPDYEDILESL